jgi:hypothetical protein
MVFGSKSREVSESLKFMPMNVSQDDGRVWENELATSEGGVRP